MKYITKATPVLSLHLEFTFKSLHPGSVEIITSGPVQTFAVMECLIVYWYTASLQTQKVGMRKEANCKQ